MREYPSTKIVIRLRKIGKNKYILVTSNASVM